MPFQLLLTKIFMATLYGTWNIIIQKALICLLKIVQLVKGHSMALKNEMESEIQRWVGFVPISICTDVRRSFCIHVRHDWDLCRKMAFTLSTSNSQACTFTRSLPRSRLGSSCVTQIIIARDSWTLSMRYNF